VEPGTHGFCEFRRTPKKRLNSRKSSNSWKKRIKNKKEDSSPPQPTPIYKLSTMSMVWNISAGSGWLPGCALSQLPHTCTSAELGKRKKLLDFLATTKNIRVLSTFFSY